MRPPKLLDPSGIIDFQTCPRKFFYRHILGWQEVTPNSHLNFGQALHAGLEHLFNSRFTEVEEAVDIATATWREHFPPSEDENYWPKTPDNLTLALHLYSSVYGEQILRDYDILGVEVVGSVPVSFQHEIVFRLDTILQEKKTGKVFVWEHKSASSISSFYNQQWILSTQINAYYLGLALMYSLEKVGGVVVDQVVFYKRKGIRTDKPPVELHQLPIMIGEHQLSIMTANTDTAISDIYYEFDSLEKQKNSGVMVAFPMRPVACTDYGRLCLYHGLCTSWANPLKKAELGPPPGMKEEFWDPTLGKIKLEGGESE